MSIELEIKLDKISTLLSERELDALLVQRVNNFAWLTCGASSYINTADSLGVVSLLITPSKRYLITNNIEEPRLREEESLESQGWEMKISPWYQGMDAVAKLAYGLRLGADTPYPGAALIMDDLVRLRSELLPVEQKRFRDVCTGCSQAMSAAVRGITPGMTEFEIGAVLIKETQQRGILPTVNLIATDERIFAYRHPLPTNKQLKKYAMLVLCGRKYGLVSSITRLIHYGAIGDDLQRKTEALAEIDAAIISSTQPGQSLGEIFKIAQENYARVGFPDEWRLHHQGGLAGYNPREIVAIPETSFVVQEGQVYAWNPSITGTKSEDTILVKTGGNEILTEIPGWPMLPVEIDGQLISRPAILEID
jgi:Xaa-Pro aminopeptidase